MLQRAVPKSGCLVVGGCWLYRYSWYVGLHETASSRHHSPPTERLSVVVVVLVRLMPPMQKYMHCVVFLVSAGRTDDSHMEQ